MIYQANALLQELKSRRDFEGIHSSSIYYLVLDKLNPKLKGSKNYDSEFGRIEITKEEVMDKLKIPPSQIWVWMDRAEEQLKRLMKTQAQLITPEGKSYYNWLSHYTKNEKGFVIQLNPFLIPYLLVLDDKAYTRIPQDLLLKMNSEYARNLIETICLFPQIGKDGKLTKTGLVKRYIDKSVIGEFLGAPEYNRWTDLKKYVLEKAVEDINSHKDETGFEIISVNYEKSGRRVVGAEFVAKVPESVWRENDRKIVHQKSEEIQKNRRVAFYLESHNITSMLDHTEETVAGRDLFALGVDMPMCDNLVKKYGVTIVNRNIKMLRQRGKIKPALLVKAIQEDYAGQSKFHDLLDFL
jgi:plasmid replication initiation protein